MQVDPEKIEHYLAQMITDLAPFCEGREPNNVLARMQSQVVPAFIRWKAGEINRSSDKNSVLNALVCVVSSQAVSIISEVIGDAEPSDDHFHLANSFLQAVGEEIGSILSGERQMQQYNVQAEHAH